MSLDWQTVVVVSLFKKVDRRMCSSFMGITLFSLLCKIYGRLLERRVHLLIRGTMRFGVFYSYVVMRRQLQIS